MNHATATPTTTVPVDLSLDADLAPAPLRVLLIEPDPAAALELRGDLADMNAGVLITHVSGALAGLRKLLHDDYDCVLLELDLPDATGLAACDAFLAHPSQPPVVVLTDYDDPSIALEAVRRGVQDWLVKGDATAEEVTKSLHFALARRNNELHLRSVRERLLAIEAEALADRDAGELQVLDATSTTDDRLAYAVAELQDAILAASTVIDDVRLKLTGTDG